jgi:hypothetical protein
MNSDFKDLLRLFAKHKVRCLVIGGYAVIHHTQPRFTKDLDLWIEPTPANAKRAAAAMREFGVPLIEITEKDLATPGTQFLIGRSPVQIDFLTSAPPLDFAACWKRRNRSSQEGFMIAYLSRDDLIAAKRHAGRQIDLADLEELERAAKARRSSK